MINDVKSAAPKGYSSRKRHSVFLAAPQPEQPRLNWLLRLRWVALIALSLTFIIVESYWSLEFADTWKFGSLLLLFLSNLILSRTRRLAETTVTGGIISVDVLLLTGLLAISGGAANPFSVLYLVLVTLGAITSTSTWTWIIVSLSSVGYAFLFTAHIQLPPELGGFEMSEHMHGASSYDIHLHGMWLAHTISSVAIAFFVSRLSRSLSQEKERQVQNARLLGLAALAAGASHEIGNPLGTITIATDELEYELSRRNDSVELSKDVQLIKEEVDRVKLVLDRLSSAAGELRGEGPVALELSDILQNIVESTGADQDRIQVNLSAELASPRWPVQAAGQAISQLIRNALQATEDKIWIKASMVHGGIELLIIDEGIGMDTTCLNRLGEPFFTTGKSGGMGLGVFIARSLIDQLSGELSFVSCLQQGTTARIWLPLDVTG